ncbi:MAG: hypothetical protein H7Z21_17900 [Hymenobacter sp.]|nr:hypothetical protein [Hymenobacter sp.]
MKTCLLSFLLLVLPLLPVAASQIVTGLRSENLVAWSVWEKQGLRLKHYLLVYNNGAQPLQIDVKLKKLRSVSTNFEDVHTNNTFFRQLLHPKQLVKFPYPRKAADLEFFEFFEAGKSVGLMTIDTSRPNAALLKEPYHFYSNQGMNSGEMLYWVALESIYTVPAHIRITAESRFRNQYYLTKLCPAYDENFSWPYKLDSLSTQDASIIKFDSARTSATLPVPSNQSTLNSNFVKLILLTEQVESGYHYDEQKRIVPDKGVTYSSMNFLPFFPRRKEPAD